MTALEMNPGIRARWTAALRSGDYPQGANALRRDGHWCCLGVLCDLAEQDGVTRAFADDLVGGWSYDGYPDLLPPSVRDWAGLADRGPVVVIEDWDDAGVPADMELTALNDDERWDFARIADAIDGTTPPAPKGK
jgi:hypothetical protein